MLEILGLIVLIIGVTIMFPNVQKEGNLESLHLTMKEDLHKMPKNNSNIKAGLFIAFIGVVIFTVGIIF